MKMLNLTLALSGLTLLTACGSSDEVKGEGNISVYQNGYIYTSDAAQSIAEAVVTQDGEILFVGTNEGAQMYVGDASVVVDLENRMMLPGLHDTHIHPMGIVDVDVCDFKVVEMNLDALVSSFEDCKATYKYGPNDVITAFSWNSYSGNNPTDTYPSMLEALDAVSLTQPVYLVGPDGHSGAANSYALNHMKTKSGEAAPALTKESLSNTYADYSDFVGVDAQGNPNGYLTEAATYLAGVPFLLSPLMDNPQELPKLSEKLNKYGITSVQDAMVDASTMDMYKTLANNGHMTFRLTAAQKYSVAGHISGTVVNFDGLMSDIKAVRDGLTPFPLIKSDAVKIVIDGVHEGNPLAFPPTLPTAYMIENYKQPVFAQDAHGAPAIAGYVDLAGDVCSAVRATLSNYDDAEVAAFIDENNIHPAQCINSKGELLASDANGIALKQNNVNRVKFLNDFVSALDQANFVAHLHAIGDGAVRASVDAIEAAKTANPASSMPHAIGHLQTVHPADQERIGKLGIYTAFTYGWANPDLSYNMSVIPFVETLDTGTLTAQTMFKADSYYMNAVYPTKTILDAGATLIGGSDAPVDTREPLPFTHMAAGITRGDDTGLVLNESEVLSVHDMIKAYTINGAKALRQDDVVGSIEVGKRADLIIIDRNIVELAELSDSPKKPEDVNAVLGIFDTQVLTTIFDGKVVYNVSAISGE